MAPLGPTADLHLVDHVSSNNGSVVVIRSHIAASVVLRSDFG